jgi:hypothetical protein
MKQLYTCNTCGVACEEVQRHHILPRAMGGTDLPTNLVDVCLDCHGKIHSKSMTHSELTRLGLARAKAAGKKLGGHRPGHTAHHEAIKANADSFALIHGPTIASLRSENKTFADIAEHFNRECIPTRSGGKWYGTTIRNIFKRYTNLTVEQTVHLIKTVIRESK